MTKPTTFAEAQSYSFGRFIAAAGVAIGFAAVGLVLILTYGGWPATLYPTIIDYLGRALLGSGGLMLAVIVFLAIGGPVRRVKLGGSKFNIETEGD